MPRARPDDHGPARVDEPGWAADSFRDGECCPLEEPARDEPDLENAPDREAPDRGDTSGRWSGPGWDDSAGSDDAGCPDQTVHPDDPGPDEPDWTDQPHPAQDVGWDLDLDPDQAGDPDRPNHPQRITRHTAPDDDTGPVEQPLRAPVLTALRALAALRPPTPLPPEPQHDPSRPLRRLVTLRDSRCDGIGCSVPARHCELDHRDPHPHGQTSPGNLTTRSQRCHHAKHTGWTTHTDPHGTTTWTSPGGRHYPVPSRRTTLTRAADRTPS